MRVHHEISAGARRRLADERGMALLVALMAILLVMALGTALVLAASVESTITRNFRNSSGALYAADAGLERAVGDLNAIADWNAVLSGAASSAFADGTPTGVRTLPDGRLIDLAEVVNLANCRQASRCSIAAMDAATADRPWGSNNPRWQPFAWGPLSGLLPADDVEPPFYRHGDGRRRSVRERWRSAGGRCGRVCAGRDRRVQSWNRSPGAPRRGVWALRRSRDSRVDDCDGAAPASVRRMTMTAAIRQAFASCPGAN